MSAGTAIFSQLTSDSTVKGIINTRVFPALVPDRQQLPQVVYDVSDDRSEPSFDGRRMSKRTVHVYSIADDYDAANDLADAVANSLDNGAGTWGGITVLGMWLESSEPGVETLPDAQEVRVYLIDQVYTLVTK